MPWNYAGTESVSNIPSSEVVDWILVELRESAGVAETASAEKIISSRAGFLLKDGSIVDLDGVSPLQFPVPIYTNLYAVVWHRNHIGIISASNLISISDIYSYDFTTGANKVLGELAGYKEIETGVFGMVGGDANADGIVELQDKNSFWNSQSGEHGYQSGDFDLNSQVNNNDKNQIWLPNSGAGSQVPLNTATKPYICKIPK